MRLQLVDKCFRENHAICLCRRTSKENKCEDVVDLRKQASLGIAKIDMFHACGVSTQNFATLKVTERLKFDEAEVCDTHDRDKIGR